MPAPFIANLPIDLQDWETMGIAAIANVMAFYFGDDVFKLLVGVGTLCLFIVSGMRKVFAAKKEYEEARSVQLENAKKELENRRLKNEVEHEEEKAA